MRITYHHRVIAAISIGQPNPGDSFTYSWLKSRVERDTPLGKLATLYIQKALVKETSRWRGNISFRINTSAKDFYQKAGFILAQKIEIQLSADRRRQESNAACTTAANGDRDPNPQGERNISTAMQTTRGIVPAEPQVLTLPTLVEVLADCIRRAEREPDRVRAALEQAENGFERYPDKYPGFMLMVLRALVVSLNRRDKLERSVSLLTKFVYLREAKMHDIAQLVREMKGAINPATRC